MHTWLYRVYPDHPAAFQQYVHDRLIAIGWPLTNRNDVAGWKASYPLEPGALWSKEVRPNQNKRTPNATQSFEILLGRMVPGDLILATYGDGRGCRVLGVGRLEAAPAYEYVADYPTDGEAMASGLIPKNRQPHTLRPVTWKFRPEGASPELLPEFPYSLYPADANLASRIVAAWESWPAVV